MQALGLLAASLVTAGLPLEAEAAQQKRRRKPVPDEQAPTQTSPACVTRASHGVPPADGAPLPEAEFPGLLRNRHLASWDGLPTPGFIQGYWINADINQMTEADRALWFLRWPDFAPEQIAQEPDPSKPPKHRTNLDNGKIHIHARVLDGLQAMQDALNTEPLKSQLGPAAKIQIRSAYRSPRRNNVFADSGRDGAHTIGAFDLGHWGNQKLLMALISTAYQAGFRGFGIGPTGLHIDYGISRADPRNHRRPWEARSWGYSGVNAIRVLEQAGLNYRFVGSRALSTSCPAPAGMMAAAQ